MNGNDAVGRICDQLRAEGLDPDMARTLEFVTWEEIVRMVITTAGMAGVFPIEWPEDP